jgi:hypothetical protein
VSGLENGESDRIKVILKHALFTDSKSSFKDVAGTIAHELTHALGGAAHPDGVPPHMYTKPTYYTNKTDGYGQFDYTYHLGFCVEYYTPNGLN